MKKASSKSHKQSESLLLIFLLVFATITSIFSLTAPQVRGQVLHLASAFDEDMAGLPYDIGPIGDGEVLWDPDEDHIINNINGYIIEAGMTVDIPTSTTISFQGMSYRMIEVYGTLITNYGSLMPPAYATFTSGDGFGWEGIIFHSGSQGRLLFTIIQGATQGVVFEEGSTILTPGILYSTFENCSQNGLKLDGVSGFTSISNSIFNDVSEHSTPYLEASNVNLDMNTVYFYSHNQGDPGLRIENASVNARQCEFYGLDKPGNMVIIEGDSNETKLDRCSFSDGLAGQYYIRVDGSSPLIVDTKFATSGGALSVVANDGFLGIPANPVMLNPTGAGQPGDWTGSFDNSSMNATGDSSVTLKWYMDVMVKNPNGDPIDKALVWVKDRLGNPSEPASKTTDATGWARMFEVAELIKYGFGSTNFNPFNISAEASSMTGYLNPEPSMNMSKRFNVTVPFNPSNVPPVVSWILTPSGIQFGLITIEFRLADPNIWDDGNLSIFVDYSTDGIIWHSVVPIPGSDTDNLDNNTLYQFVWDSADPDYIGNAYAPTVYIRITPCDRTQNGTPAQTGSFIVDNKPPLVSWLPTPVGVQSGLITIQYRVVGFNLGDDGDMGVYVFFSKDNVTWLPATQGGGDPTTGLLNNTLYTFIWDSRASKNLDNQYSTTVYIKLIPFNAGGNGTGKQTGNFTVDNMPPIFISGPTVNPSNTTCIVQWTMAESTYATVFYGLNLTGGPGDLTYSTSDPTFSTLQSVTLTGLAPGREYIYTIKSTDEGGNIYTTSSLFTFDTKIHIQLYKGWNLISLPPQMTANDLPTVFASIAGLYDSIQFYNPYDLNGDPWKQYIPGKPFGNDLFTIYTYMGVYVHMLTDAVFVHTTHSVPKAPTANPTEDIPLDKGWNLVGYPSVTNRPVATALSGVTYDLIQTYNAESGQWESYNGVSGDLTMLEMGRGYWIHVPPSVPGMQFWSVTYHD